ncbi:MAG: hypothetical protein RQ754_02185 [Desulfuromonadales bacterium]|nr:hypothetical protein [Desulfuromonadales bacterium]
MAIWFRTDEFEEATLSLEKVAETSDQIANDPSQWRWVVIALHNAVQGFMVLALRGTNNISILELESAKEWLKALPTGGPYPKFEKLDSFLNLYKKIKSDRMLMYGHSKKFTPQGSQGGSIKKLNQFRNEFIHFIPKGWSIEVSGMPSICIDCLNIIGFLGWESGNVRWDENDIEVRAEGALRKACKTLENIKEMYRKESV